MNLKEAIKASIATHDSKWFDDISEEFYTHPDYDKGKNSVRVSVEYERIHFDYSGKDQSSARARTTTELVEEYYDLKRYSWQGDSASSEWDFPRKMHHTFHTLLEHIENSLLLTGDIRLKKEILRFSKDLIKEEVEKIRDGGSDLFRSILWSLYTSIRKRLYVKYKDVDFIMSNFNAGEASTFPAIQKSKIKTKEKHLRKRFFEEIFQWNTPQEGGIIDISHLKNADSYGHHVYEMYIRGKVPNNLEIDFLWDRGAVYYLLNRITQLTKKFTVKQLVESKTITIKGTLISTPEAFRKGAHRFAMTESDLKDFVDSAFSDELER